MEKDTIYTIGYSGFQVDEFISTLKRNGVNALIDVRSEPYSAYHHDYDKETLSQNLRKNHIYYRNYAKEFGARQENHGFYKNGRLDFDSFSKSPQFQSGVSKIVEGANQGFTFAFMCAEKDPLQCHRAILVAKAFSDMGFSVKHVVPVDGKIEIETQQNLEDEMIDCYFPPMFRNESKEALLADAYRRKNDEIGFKLEDLK